MASQVYLDNIYAPTRRTAASVSFSLTPPESKELANVTTPDGSSFSRPDQILDNIIHISKKMATFEPGHWKLDGSFALPVLPDESNSEIGFWSADMSDENGEFASNVVMEVVFSQVQDIQTFAVAFDRPGNNYPKMITVTAYNSAGGQIMSETTTENDSVYYETAQGAVNVYRVVMEFNWTNNSQRYLRIGELNFGRLIVFTNDNITDLDLIREADPTGRSLPYPELNISVLNDGKFNALDSTSYAQYLYVRQSLEYEHGVYTDEDKMDPASIEWVYCGAYYLTEWDIADDIVKLTATGKTAALENLTYFGSGLSQYTLGQLINNVLGGAGFDVNYPAALDSTPLISGYFGEVSYRDCAAYLAELSCCLVFENIQNTIEFVDIVAALEQNSPVDTVDYTKTFGSPKAKTNQYYNGITLKEYTVTGSGADMQLDAQEIFYPAPWRDPKEPDIPYSVDLPMMIHGDNFAALRDWFLERKFQYMLRRLIYDVNWRQNPDRNVGEIISAQADKKGLLMIPLAAYKHSLDFSGGILRGSTQAISLPVFY